MANSISLSARAVAEYLSARDGARDGVLAKYARPDDEQVAIKIMHNPVRKGMRGVLTDGINESELLRLDGKIREHRAETEPDKIWIASCLKALDHLRALQIEGMFKATQARRLDLTVENVRVRSSVDFYGTFVSSNGRVKPRQVAVIVNIPGLKMADESRRKLLMQAEGELAMRTSKANNITTEDVLYIDLPRRTVTLRYSRTSERLWKDIQRVCRTIATDFPRIEAEMQRRARNRRESA